MRPDCSISWSLYNDSNYQWIDTNHGGGDSMSRHRCEVCSDFLFRSLSVFGAKMKHLEDGRKLASVSLVFLGDEFGVKGYRFETLRGVEIDMVLAVSALLKGWAYEHHLPTMSQEKLDTIVV